MMCISPSNRSFYCCASAWLLLLLWSASASASSIRVESANLRNTGSVYVLDANIAIDLNSTIENGLQSGVALFFNVDVTITQHRRYWLDKRVAKYRRRYSLIYYELTRHYRVTIVDQDVTKNFRSLFSALDFIGSVRDMPLFKSTLLKKRSRLRGDISVFLDTSSLPLPLRSQTLLFSAWRPRSEEFRWPIN